MTEADIPQLRQMDKLSHLTPWSATQFKQCLIPPNYAWVLKQNQMILGFAIARLVADESELLNLVIDKAHQGQKLGHFLLTCICNEVQDRGASCMFLEVRRSNSIALKLYEKFGFNYLATRKDYYPTASGKEDALILRKDF